MNTRVFSKSELIRLNSSNQYGYGWIKNLENVRSGEAIKLYPTGYHGMTTGRLYVALSANKELTDDDVIKHNIICRNNN
jgi:hypothetical protein